MEKNTSANSVLSDHVSYSLASSDAEEGTFFSRLIDSFKPIQLEDDGVDTSNMTPMEKSIYATARHPLARRLKSRHLQMIAIGGSIGTGLFIGSGYALYLGGPAGAHFLCVSWLLVVLCGYGIG